MLFVYGWLLSLLAGNASIVRVSQKASAVRQAFLSVMEEIAADRSFAPVLGDSWLITYPHEDVITAKISAACDARLVWGGDATVLRSACFPSIHWQSTRDLPIASPLPFSLPSAYAVIASRPSVR